MNFRLSRTSELVVTAVIACFLGAVGGAVAFQMFYTHSEQFSNTATREGNKGLLINPLLSCDISEDMPAPELSSVQTHLQDAVDKAIQSGSAGRVSVYVRNMNTGDWTGVNVNDSYAPASLMKLPVLIAYLKQAEENPSLLETRLTLSSNDQNAQEFFKPANPLSPGSAYSVRDLLLAMIQNSDNNAANALKNAISEKAIVDVYNAFDEPVITESQDAQNLMTPKKYMRFFRILYNASYLDKDISQQTLSVLSQTTFKQGLAAGVPGNVVVAHKFGERTLHEENAGTGKTSLQLHDCGIVYDAHVPYGICVMTEGDDFTSLASAIASVSKRVYIDAEQGLLGGPK